MRLALALVSFVVCGAAHAAPVLKANRSLHAALKAAAAKAPHTRVPRLVPKDGECSDFSGHWKGVCGEGTEDAYDDELSIGQDGCTEMYWEGSSFTFGGMTTTNDTNPGNMTTNVAAMPEWGSSLKSFRIHFDMSARSLVEEEFIFLRGSVENSLVEGKLISRSSFDTRMIYAGNTYDGKNQEECIYEKVSK